MIMFLKKIPLAIISQVVLLLEWPLVASIDNALKTNVAGE